MTAWTNPRLWIGTTPKQNLITDPQARGDNQFWQWAPGGGSMTLEFLEDAGHPPPFVSFRTALRVVVTGLPTGTLAGPSLYHTYDGDLVAGDLVAAGYWIYAQRELSGTALFSARADGNTIGFTSTPVELNGGTWNYVAAVINIVEASTSTVIEAFVDLDGLELGDTFDLTGGLVAVGTDETDYFDGDSPLASWDGAPGASTSTVGAEIPYNVTLAERTTRPTAYLPVVIEWDQDTTVSNPQAAALTVDVAVPAGGRWPALGDPVRLRVDATNLVDIDVFYGVVDGLRRTRRTLRNADGSTFVADVLRVEAVDWLGALARLKIADEPWPEESWPDRMRRIQDLTPTIAWGFDARDYGLSGPETVAPRDVDNAPALDVVLDTIIGYGYRLVSGERGLDLRSPSWFSPGTDLLELRPDGPVIVPGGAPFTVNVSADLIVDTDRVHDYDTVINRAAYTYKVPDPENPGEWVDRTVTSTNRPSIAAYGESAISFGSDATDPTWGESAAQRMTEGGRPVWRFDGDLELLVSRFVDEQRVELEAVLQNGQRNDLPLYIAGAPSDVAPSWRLMGGRLVVGTDRVDAGDAREALTLRVQPHEVAVGTGLKFVDTVITPSATFAEFADLTFADTLSVGAVTREA